MWGFLPDMMHNCSQANAYFLIISDGKYPEFSTFCMKIFGCLQGTLRRGAGNVRRMIKNPANAGFFNHSRSKQTALLASGVEGRSDVFV